MILDTAKAACPSNTEDEGSNANGDKEEQRNQADSEQANEGDEAEEYDELKEAGYVRVWRQWKK